MNSNRSAIALAAALAACATVRAPPPSAQCEAALRDGNARYDARDWAGAAERYRAARDACGDSRSASDHFSDSTFAALRLAVVLHNAGDDDGVAETLAAVVTRPDPPTDGFVMLHDLRENLSPAARRRLSELGSTIDAPIYVPDVRLERLWTEDFGCPERKANVAMQSLLKGKGPGCVLDAIRFTCGDAPVRNAYFDFSADPRDKDLRRRTGYDPCKDK
jgi:hypothetical protein